jgi:NAD+ synthase
MQSEISAALGVSAGFDPASEAEKRIDFLRQYLIAARLRTYVLGISGGVDSLTAGLLAQSAVRVLRENGYDSEFVAVRLPYGVQADEHHAQLALEAIGPDRTLVVDVKPASDAVWLEIASAGIAPDNAGERDTLLGNVKARQRMVAQFAIAGSLRGLVIGTDHAAEAVMGFFTKFGDGAADLLPLAGLNKRRVRAIASHLGAPAELIDKVPTADLEDGAPLRPDEDVFGVSYDQIDDFLEGKQVGETAVRTIVAAYRATSHKRALPVTPSSA